MANNFFSSFTENGQNKLIKSMLECSLLFSLNRNPVLNESRKNMFLQSVFAIICSEDQEWTETSVHDVFHDKFGREYEIKVIREAIKKLLKDGLLTPSGSGYVPNKEMAESMRQENDKVEESTGQLFNAIIDSVEKRLSAPLTSEERAVMERNIESTFNLYVRMYGFDSFVSMTVSTTKEIIEDDDIVNAAILDLPEKQGEMLVAVLSELLEKPTHEQSKLMMLWVKMYLATQIMGLDPQLSELEKENLRGKKFVIDTDFLLYCLVEHPQQSEGYRRLLRILRDAGCQLIIPEEVVKEVLVHAQCAEGNYSRFKKVLKSVDKGVIEQMANNVFVKNYCLYDINAKRHQTIRQYMNNNYLSDDEPLEFIKKTIRDQLHIEPCTDEPLEVGQEYLVYQEQLTSKIFERTRRWDTGKWRTDDEVQALSRTDARLYLSVYTLNQDVKDNSIGEMLRAKAYLVTGTTKSLKSAQEMGIGRNFVTRPELLINLMTEIGEFDGKDQALISLFDNPFLAHVINSNWDLIKNLTDTGLNMHDKSITKLKEDLGKVYHKYLTDDADKNTISITPDFNGIKISNPKTFFEYANEVNKLNYSFVPEVQKMIDEYNSEISKRTSAEEKQRIAEKLLSKKASGYAEYLEKVNVKRRRTNLGYKKK